MKPVRAACSWSGGKDSCLALHAALGRGIEVTKLLNFVSAETLRGAFHGIEGALMRAQAERIGIPLTQKPTTPDMTSYEAEFKEAVRAELAHGVTHMILGDIYLPEHANWVERVCGEVGIVPISPLWNRPPRSVVDEFCALGFKAVIASCKADILDSSYPGRVLDSAMAEDFARRGICPCGEHGEYHTFVVDGPLFREPVRLLRTRTVTRDGFWRHHFLDIREFA